MNMNEGSDNNPHKALAKLTKFALIGVALVISAVLLAIVAWEVFSTDPPAQLNVDNFTLVKVGMTQDEVEKLLGGPPGDYGRNKHEQGFMTLEGFTGPRRFS